MRKGHYVKIDKDLDRLEVEIKIERWINLDIVLKIKRKAETQQMKIDKNRELN